MTDPAKYIVFMSGGCETAIVFPCWMNHCDMVQGGEKVVSAGQVVFSHVTGIGGHSSRLLAECFGESISLKVKSRWMQDAELIESSLMQQERRSEE